MTSAAPNGLGDGRRRRTVRTCVSRCPARSPVQSSVSIGDPALRWMGHGRDGSMHLFASLSRKDLRDR
jgi:hypothetical protein